MVNRIPPHSGIADICNVKDQERHQYGHCFHIYPSKETGKYDWGKLVRVLRYIICTLHLTLILRSGSLSVIKWWVNVSFSAHPDCKGHTEEMMSLGSGYIMELLRKKKINGRISTEANIVGIRKCLDTVLVVKILL